MALSMTETAESPSEAMETIAGAIRDMRDALLRAGYRHANSAGELVSADDTTWIGTSYVYGEYSVYAWRRPRGYGEIGEVRHVMRVHGSKDLPRLQELGRRLARWAKKPPAGTNWPVRGLGPLA